MNKVGKAARAFWLWLSARIGQMLCFWSGAWWIASALDEPYLRPIPESVLRLAAGTILVGIGLVLRAQWLAKR